MFLVSPKFYRMVFPIVEEQKKIAISLSSIDTKIDIENQLLQRLEEEKDIF